MAKISPWREVRAEFAKGADEHPHFNAHWEHPENVWRLVDEEPHSEGALFTGATFRKSPVANPEAEKLFKSIARTALGLLGFPRDSTPAWQVWLSCMRKGQHGFGRTKQAIFGSDFRRFVEQGIEPSVFKLKESGGIYSVFSRSADLCDELDAGLKLRTDSPDIPDVLSLYEAMVQRWLRSEWCPERDERLAEVDRQNLTTLGRVSEWIRIFEELLNRQVRECALSYLSIARKYGCSEMLSGQRLKGLTQQLERAADGGIGYLRTRIDIRLAAVGDVSPAAIPKAPHYVQLRGRIQGTIVEEVHVLAAEGKLMSPLGLEPPKSDVRKVNLPKLDTTRIKTWMDDEGWDVNTLAKGLGVSTRTIGSILNNGKSHGKPATQKLASKMGCEFTSDLYLA